MDVKLSNGLMTRPPRLEAGHPLPVLRRREFLLGTALSAAALPGVLNAQGPLEATPESSAQTGDDFGGARAPRLNASIDLATAGALETAEAVRSGACSALEVCDAAIARIEALDGPLNAVVVRDFDRARDAARAIDRQRKPDDGRRFLGVPMTVKESNDVAGLPSTWGLEMFSTATAVRDSAVVQRLKAEGAVILGKTNVPVMLGDWQAANPIYGRTVNPYDATRSPGGSSGGAAAALASGMVPLEIGSDIGGSIRVPAHMCGVFGHKPTYGIVPQRGHMPAGMDGVETPLAAIGPMARSAADLAAALAVIAGPETGSGYRLALPEARHHRLSDYRVRVLREMPGVPADADTHTALDQLVRGLETAGAAISDVSAGLPDLEALLETYLIMLPTITSRGAPGAVPVDAHHWMGLLDTQLDITRSWKQLFDEVDIVISPVFSTPAFPHDDNPDTASRVLKVDDRSIPYESQLAWAAIANFAGLPATSVPVAYSRSGLPIGMQLMSAPFADWTTLRFAALLEAEGLTA